MMNERQLDSSWDDGFGASATKLLALSLMLLAVTVPLVPVIDALNTDGGTGRLMTVRAAVDEPAAGRGARVDSPSVEPPVAPADAVSPPPAAVDVTVVDDAARAPQPGVGDELPVSAPAGAISPYAGTHPGARSSDGTWRLLYVGDSLAWLTEQHLRSMLSGDVVDMMTFGGTAPCDWVGRVIDQAAVASADLVVISFLGNNLTPCTGNALGQPLLDAYQRDLSTMCAAVAPARCVLVGQPTVPIDVGWNMPGGDQPTTMYRALAEEGQWGFVDAGSAVETADGRFDPALRSEDRVHFSDDGARRYAATIARFVDDIRA
jgi:GDSL-like Lipase/Acylhydrolase family